MSISFEAVLDTLTDAHLAGDGVLSYMSLYDKRSDKVCRLRLVNKKMKRAVVLFPWRYDRVFFQDRRLTRKIVSIPRWHLCFPRATEALFSDRCEIKTLSEIKMLVHVDAFVLGDDAFGDYDRAIEPSFRSIHVVQALIMSACSDIIQKLQLSDWNLSTIAMMRYMPNLRSLSLEYVGDVSCRLVAPLIPMITEINLSGGVSQDSSLSDAGVIAILSSCTKLARVTVIQSTIGARSVLALSKLPHLTYLDVSYNNYLLDTHALDLMRLPLNELWLHCCRRLSRAFVEAALGKYGEYPYIHTHDNWLEGLYL